MHTEFKILMSTPRSQAVACMKFWSAHTVEFLIPFLPAPQSSIHGRFDPSSLSYLSLKIFTFGWFEVSMKSQTVFLNPLVSMLLTRLLMSSGKYILISSRLHCWKTDIIQQLPFPLVSLSILKGKPFLSIRLLSSSATDLSKWKFSKIIFDRKILGYFQKSLKLKKKGLQKLMETKEKLMKILEKLSAISKKTISRKIKGNFSEIEWFSWKIRENLGWFLGFFSVKLKIFFLKI